MALKRNYLEGTKFSYAKIDYVQFMKDIKCGFRVTTFERDSANPEYDRRLNCLDFQIQSFDPGFEDFFTLTIQNEANTNIIKQCYEYLKAKEDLFRGFEDC